MKETLEDNIQYYKEALEDIRYSKSYRGWNLVIDIVLLAVLMFGSYSGVFWVSVMVIWTVLDITQMIGELVEESRVRASLKANVLQLEKLEEKE